MSQQTRSHDQNPPRQHRFRRRGTAAVLSFAVAAAAALTAVTLASAPSAHAAGGVPAPSPVGISGRGANVPFTEYEAEYANTNGALIGPDRLYTHLPSEASGRQAVTLDAVGQYVEFTLTKPANAMSLRYSIPDSADGKGRDASLDVQANGQSVKTLPVTSRYSWYYGGYPFSNDPGGGNAHHFYDESRTMFGTTYQAGTEIRVQVTSTAQSPSFTIDLADFEQVAAPIAQPSGSINAVTDYGADPTGATDSTAKIQAAVDAGQAQGKPVYIPQGDYTLYDHVIVDGVTVEGAGPWYTVFGGRDPVNRNRAAGFYGKYVAGGGYTGEIRPKEAGGPSKNVTLKDFAIIGDITERVDDDQVNGIGGALSNSTIDDLWIQHVKVGAWMDGPMDHLTIENSRILDTSADGVNFHSGVTDSTVTNTFVRDTGDDGLASWPEKAPNADDSFTHNTVVLPVLANNIVTYGGKDFTISDNVMADTVTNGGGLHIANRYPGVNGGSANGVSGTITADSNTLIRAGNSDYNWQFGVGAIWFDGLQGTVDADIEITNTDILDSSYEAIQSIEGGGVTGVHFKNVNIDGAGTFAIQGQAPANMTFTNVTAKNIAQADKPIYNCEGTALVLNDSGGNSGWNNGGQQCNGWPAPVWTNGGVPTGGGSGGDSGGTTPPTTPPATPPTTPPTTPPADGNLAKGHPATDTGHSDVYTAANAVDGDANSYWESTNNAFPQSLTVDLGSARTVGRLVLKLPPAAAWATRTETLSVLGSTDGSTFSTLKSSAGYTFDPSSGNTATVSLSPTSTRYLRLTFTANTGWPAGQLSELEAYAS
ncbi:discoidin domain-containing protein [Streptomyces sp. NBC_00448]|uniref:discoidin domain-containing protein n=1 Tax=Streptomyces sp. NBC_00448 TaxID=2903652 RepID=UPI002E23BEE3